MAEASAGISIYVSDHPGDHSESMGMLRDAGQKLQQALRMTWRANQIASIFEGYYKPRPETVDLRAWASAPAPSNLAFYGESGRFVFDEPVVAEMFLTIAFDNVAAHAAPGAPVTFTATLSGGYLRMEICNGLRASGNSTGGGPKCPPMAWPKLEPSSASFSTGLGLNDMREVSRLRGIAFKSALSTSDGLWHSSVKIPALRFRGQALEGGNSTKEQKLDKRAPPIIRHIAIVDDLPLNMKMAARRLERQIPGVVVDMFKLNTTVSYSNFVGQTIPANCQAWDLVLMDYCLEMKDDGSKRYGTHLLDQLQEAGCRACLVMNSGNNTEEDVDKYKLHGAIGAVGKGTENLVSQVIGFHREFHEQQLCVEDV